jgi:hypothetical protein
MMMEKQENKMAAPEVVDSGLIESVVQVHLGEYQALTTRNTYWITLQYACWPILLVYVALAGQFVKVLDREVLIWGSGFVVQLVVVSWYQAAQEQYRNVIYMETQLRPLLQRLLRSSNLMGYERFLARQRSDGPLWYEVWPAIANALLFVAVLVGGRPWSVRGWIGGAVNGLLVLVVAKFSRSVVTLRGQFFDEEALIQ